jgi:Tol biopolymer transport system component
MMRGRFVILLIALWLIVGLPHGALAQDAASEPSGVWVARVDGSEPTLIAPGAFLPDWSPDGQQIAFAAYSSEGMGLVASAPDGTAATPILSDPALWPLAPRWSPDGSLVAFSGSEYPAEAALVGVARADGSGVVWTQSTGSRYPVALDWSPDGAQLAWASESGSSSELWVADANGANAVRLAEVMGTIEGIAWAPDGDRLAFHAENYDDRDRTTLVAVIGADGSGLTTIAASELEYKSSADDFEPLFGTPAWSLDGATIAISLTRGVALIGTNDGTMTVLPTPGMMVYEVAWSPDNATFALSAYDEDEEFDRSDFTGMDLYLMNADGTGFRVLAATPLEDWHPVWSPDGASVAFAAEPAGE